MSRKKAWSWIPSLYFGEGLPYVAVLIVSVIMYKRMGISNTDIALYTSWLYLPWVIKPLWSPFVDIIKTKRWWIITMQLLIGAGFGGVALMIPAPDFFTYTLAFLWLLAFSSATHDIAADGFYMLALDEGDQSFFVGIRSTFYRVAMLTGQGLLIVLAGSIESNTGLPTINYELTTVKKEFVNPLHPDSLQYKSSTDQPIQILGSNDGLSLKGMRSKQKDSLVSLAKNWNQENNFVSTVSQKASNSIQTKTTDGIWSKWVIKPLARFIQSNFGHQKKAIDTERTGAIQFVYYKLSESPKDGEEIVLNIDRDSGDPNIQLIEGTRFSFNASNWDKPAISVFQVDKKARNISKARFEGKSGDIVLSWTISFFILMGLFIGLMLYHRFVLPKPESDITLIKSGNEVFKEFANTFTSFFKKKDIVLIMFFLLFYRFAEAQLVKLASPFLLDARELGGLGLTTGDVGWAYGTVGMLALTFGGILGGLLASKDGLKHWFWAMVIAINIPNAVYVFLSLFTPEAIWIVHVCVAIEQFGYGFGFTAYMLYMIYISDGEHKTAHFAICTGFMALGMMIPGMFSGWLQELIGYQNFFIWVMIATIPAFLISALIKIEPEFAKKKAD